MRGIQGRTVVVLTFTTALLITGVISAAAAAEKKQKPKPAIVEIQKLNVALHGSQIDIDGIVHNGGERPMQKLILSFHFFDTQHQPVTTLKLDVDPDTIDPGDDTEIHAAANEPPRAVSMEVTASDHGERDLKVVNAGPYRIE